MSLSFLVPAFLVGLAALAIPVLIHLTRKNTNDPTDFPSLMFVQRIPHKSTQRRRIRNWPLLLLRCLAIGLIALAFARPFLNSEEANAAAAATGTREVVILLDRSYSMGFGDRWERAKGEALEAIEGLGQYDRATLLLFDTRSEAVVESSLDRALLRSAVEDAEVGSRSTRYAPAFRYAERVLSASAQPRREVVLISDFQRNAWDTDVGEAASITLPARTVITPISMAEGEPSNVTIGSVTFRRTVAAGRERAIATARLVNQGPVARPGTPVTLEIDGRRVETQTVDLAASGAATVEFAAVTLAATGMTRGSVRLPDDSLAADNVFNFALSPDQRLGVVIVDGGGGSQASYFLERSLAIGDAPGFRTVIRPAGGLRAVDLEQASVVLLNQAAIPSGVVGERLRTFVENGGGVVFLMGDNRTGGWEGVLPDRVGRVVDYDAQGGIRIGFIDFGHPAFEAFSTPRSGDFTAARFYRYRAIPAVEGQRILAKFSDGGAALTEQSVGKGRVLVWASTVDGDWNDLAVQPVFLPFVHQLVKHASGYAPAMPAFTVGDPFDPAIMAAAAQQFGLAMTPSGERVELEEDRPLTLDEPGFYELRDARSGAQSSAIAVNVDPAESNLEAISPEEVVRVLSPDDATARASGPLTLTVQEREREQSAWWYLVVIGFVLLAIETVLSNWKRRTVTA